MHHFRFHGPVKSASKTREKRRALPSFPYMVIFQLVKKEQEYQDLEGKHTQTMFDYQAKVSKFEEEKKQLVIEV